jgi:hypothetical protein
MSENETPNPGHSESVLLSQILEELQNGGGGSYTLPIAQPTVLGGIKPDNTTLTVNATTGVASAASFTPPYTAASDAITLFNNHETNPIILLDNQGNPFFKGYGAGGTAPVETIGFGPNGNLCYNNNYNNSAGGLVVLNGTGQLPAVSGALLTGLPATNGTFSTFTGAGSGANYYGIATGSGGFYTSVSPSALNPTGDLLPAGITNGVIQIIVAGAAYIFYTTDGGYTWTQGS